jgi:hypothetical protein
LNPEKGFYAVNLGVGEEEEIMYEIGAADFVEKGVEKKLKENWVFEVKTEGIEDFITKSSKKK